MTSSLGEFIYDSSIIIAQVFEESRFESRILHLEKEVARLGIDHLATPLIIRETRSKVKYVGEYLSQTVRELHRTMMYRKDPSNTNPSATFGEDDIPFIKTYFSNLAKNMGGNRSDQIHKEFQDYFETWIITNFHDSLSTDRRRTVPISEFMTKCASWATDLHSSLNAELQRRISKSTDVASDDQTLEYVKSRLPFIKNDSDKAILSEVLKYQKKQNKLVFVALDYRDLVSHSSEIAQEIGVRVADPLYALDLLKDPRVGKPVSISTPQDFMRHHSV